MPENSCDPAALNEKADRFLDAYRRLETAAERIVGHDERGASSIVRLGRDRRFFAYREQLDTCREVRNLLSHEAKVDGQYPVIPSDGMLAVLLNVLRQIEDPPAVTSVMTPVEQLVTVNENRPVLPVMERMRQQNLSHVPILKDGCVAGIFSVGTVFQAVLDGACTITPETCVRAFARYLPLDRHMGQDFRFIARSTSVTDAEAVFDRAYDRNHKLKLLLVTETGRRDERLLGVISPYDLLG